METAQCAQPLPGGERCSNRARPGTPYCEAHAPKRIVFTPVAPTPPPTAPAARQPRAIAASVDQTPLFPGLRRDDRHILVGPRGVVYLPSGKDESFSRTVRFLGLLSQMTPLAGLVRLARWEAKDAWLIFLTPREPGTARLSNFYDDLYRISEPCGGTLYVGADQAYVQFADDHAPHGHDVPDFEPSENWILVGRDDCLQFTTSELREESLADFCLQITPVMARHAPAPAERLFVLAAGELYLLLARYFRAHGLSYDVARFHGEGQRQVLFQVRPRPGKSSQVPGFIVDFLKRLPRTTVLLAVHETAEQRILLQWGWEYPLRIAHLADVFGPQDLLLLQNTPRSSLRVSPAPVFFSGDHLLEVHVPHAPSPPSVPVQDRSESLRLEVRLRQSDSPAPAATALLLRGQERDWLRTMLYRLPGELFHSYSFRQGQDLTVLLGDDRGITGIPFGEPLRRLGDTHLFIPLRSRLWPELPTSMLDEIMKLSRRTYTFLSRDGRYDLATNEFAPLSRLLMVEPGRPCPVVRLQTDLPLPELPWQPPAPPEVHTARLEPRVQAPAESRAQITPTPAAPAEPNLRQVIMAEARACEAAKDYLGAALYYGLARDFLEQARCFRQAAEDLGE